VKLLVVASEPISARQLRAAVGDGATDNQTEVMVVAPALQESAVRFWLSDADQAIARAEEVRQETVQSLDEEGVAASGDTGESDALDAIQDALRTFAADRIVLFTHPGSQQRYREDVAPSEVEDRFGLPVDRATVEE
jgi:broad specificity polyphosphatase/5'/3'-nucleotidase SurE